MFLDVYSKEEYAERMAKKKKKFLIIFFCMTIPAGFIGLPYGTDMSGDWVYAYMIGFVLGCMFALIPYSSIYEDENILSFGIFEYFKDKNEEINRAKHIGNYTTGAYAIKYFNPTGYYEITTNKAFYVIKFEDNKVEILKEENLES